jgi:hypothetical protein
MLHITNFVDFIHCPCLIRNIMFWRWEASSIDWTQQSRHYLKTKTESSLQNVMFLIKLVQEIMSKKYVILTIHHCHTPSDCEAKSVCLDQNVIFWT